MNRDVSAIIIAFVPAIIIVFAGQARRSGDIFFLVSAAAVVLSLIVFHLLRRWPHPGVLMLLAVGVPAMLHVFVATHMPLFLPLFYAFIALVAISSCLGALVTGCWHWSGVGSNAGYFMAVLLAGVLAGVYLGREHAEACLLAASAFSITRLCNVDLLSWMRIVPKGIHNLMEKLWY